MANATTETKLEPLDFIAPRALVLTCDNCDADIDIQKGGRVRFSRGEDCWLVWDGQEDPGDGYAAEDPWDLDDECDCVPRVHAELVALRDSAAAQDFGAKPASWWGEPSTELESVIAGANEARATINDKKRAMAENFSEMVKAAHRIKPAKWQDALVRELVGHVRAADIPDAEVARVFEDAIVADVAAQVAKVKWKPVDLDPVAPALEVGGMKIIAPADYAQVKAEAEKRAMVAVETKEIPIFPLDPSEAEQLQREMNETVERIYAGMGVSRMPATGEVPRERSVTLLDRVECWCEFGTEAGDMRDRMHIRRDAIARVECGMYESFARQYEDHRPVMVSTIVAEQVSRGGVDTEGTRAQAERWCAWLCECVCEGMRATTDASAYRLAKHEALGYRVAPGGRAAGALFRGKPLGRP